MAVLNPEHLLDQADRLSVSLQGPPRQVDLRRAISSSYYALFHSIVTAAADAMIGAVHQSSGRYRLIYRSIDHRTIATICADVQKMPLPQKYGAYIPADIFHADIRQFSGIVRDLQQRRHQADYDPHPRFKTADALIAIRLARQAAELFSRISDPERKAFLTLLVCPPR